MTDISVFRHVKNKLKTIERYIVFQTKNQAGAFHLSYKLGRHFTKKQ